MHLDQPADPGYGDPLAPIGSPEWAKRWRLMFQSTVKDLPRTPGSCLKYFEVGQQYRAWTLLTDAHGKHFPDFDTFCATEQPWGLGMDPVKFRAHLKAEIGDKATDLMTVSPDGRSENGANQHTGPKEDSGHNVPNPEAQERKEKRLRAILRAPELVQNLYRDGRINQTDAAAMGPKSPKPEKAAAIAEARQDLERLDRNLPPREFRKQAGNIVCQRLGKESLSSLEKLKRDYDNLSPADRETFLLWVNQRGA